MRLIRHKPLRCADGNTLELYDDDDAPEDLALVVRCGKCQREMGRIPLDEEWFFGPQHWFFGPRPGGDDAAVAAIIRGHQCLTQ